jgi:hypothetical protein
MADHDQAVASGLVVSLSKSQLSARLDLAAAALLDALNAPELPL